MGKIIRLTESDLIRIIKRVINEQPTIGGIPAAEIVTSASDIGLQIGVDVGGGNLTDNYCPGRDAYEIVAKIFNWCRTDPRADKYAWKDNWAASQVKQDVQTTSAKDLIIPALTTIKTEKDFCQFVNSYYKFKGDLYNDIDKYVIMTNKWNRILYPIPSTVKSKSLSGFCKEKNRNFA